MSSEAQSRPERVTARMWVDVLGGIRFGSVTVGGKRVSGSTIKAVGIRLAWWADSIGDVPVRPRVEFLAMLCEVDNRAVARALAVLCEVGLLERVAGARPPGETRNGAAITTGSLCLRTLASGSLRFAWLR